MSEWGRILSLFPFVLSTQAYGFAWTMYSNFALGLPFVIRDPILISVGEGAGEEFLSEL